MNYLVEQFGLKDRHAVVTGAGRGIGRACALALAAAGAEVLVHYRKSKKEAEEVVAQINADGGRAWAAGADLTRSDEVKNLFSEVEKKWGSLDLLVNNAGDLGGRSELAAMSDDQINHVLQANLHSMLFSTRSAVPLLHRGRDPAIVNLTSIGAHNGGVGGVTIYVATKGAILSATRSLARELAPRIRVNAIAPGFILTDLHRIHSTEEKLKQLAENTPLKRNGTAEECASVVVFLCGKGASFLTGEIIEINGGLWMA